MTSAASKERRRRQRVHTIRRLRERYGLEFTSREYKELCNAIRNDESSRVRFITRYSLRLTVHAITLGDKEVFVVYDKERHSIATVLSPNMVKE